MRALALLAFALPTPAVAYHCPHGQWYRVHLDKCVSLSSPLAYAYEPKHAQVSRKDWYVEVIHTPPPAEPPAPPKPETDEAAQRAHDAAVAAHHDEINRLMDRLQENQQ